MLKQIMPAIRTTIVLAILFGLIFPIITTVVSQSIFPIQANGSLIKNKHGQVLGSELIGQKFSQAKYFQPRPSAAGSGYAGEYSGGTNLGPTASKLINGECDDPTTKDINESFIGIKELAHRYTIENLLSATEKPPVDAVTYSGSGLDPHISERNALFQARRVSKARSISLESITSLIRKQTEKRQFGIFGEPRVNVLKLNLALEELI